MRSDQIKKGVERAPNRSLLYALGYTEEELNRPLVGVVGPDIALILHRRQFHPAVSFLSGQ